MTHGSLFSGIGGFDLAAEWAGFENKWQVEIDPWCRRVLGNNFPGVKRYEDIRDVGKHNLERVDVISGGFPCQKYSSAGKQRGDEPLKEELLRCIRELNPRWCIIENVHNFIGTKFAPEHELLCSYLENIGYKVQTFDIDSSAVGLHTMERHIWIIAAADSVRFKRGRKETLQKIEGISQEFSRNHQRENNRWHLPEARVCGRTERIPHRVDRIRGLGNAIVPEVALQFFLIINSIGG